MDKLFDDGRLGKRVLVVGGVSYDTLIYLDRFPQPTSHTVFAQGFHETVGSTGAGKALNLCRLGLRVTLHGLIGEDEAGDKVREVFRHEPLTFLYDLDPTGTPRHVNLMEAAGGRISIFGVPGSSDPQVDLGRLAPLVAGSDFVVLSIIHYVRGLIPYARQAGKEIWCDLHDYDGRNPYHQDFIDAADYLFMSSDALPDYQPFMQTMHERGKRLVVCTHGWQGATALTAQGEWIEMPAISAYGQVDTNGAGDAFFSGFLYGFAQGYPVRRCLQTATVTAGLCVASAELANPGLSARRVEAEVTKYFG